jgi:hypothetical protein
VECGIRASGEGGASVTTPAESAGTENDVGVQGGKVAAWQKPQVASSWTGAGNDCLDDTIDDSATGSAYGLPLAVPPAHPSRAGARPMRNRPSRRLGIERRVGGLPVIGKDLVEFGLPRGQHPAEIRAAKPALRPAAGLPRDLRQPPSRGAGARQKARERRCPADAPVDQESGHLLPVAALTDSSAARRARSRALEQAASQRQESYRPRPRGGECAPGRSAASAGRGSSWCPPSPDRWR